MGSAEYAPNSFDVYVLRLGRISAGISVALLAMKFLEGCGGIVASLYSIAQILLLMVLLWIPLLWRRIKDIPPDNLSAKWALIGSLSPFAVLVMSMVFDTTGKHGCFR
jgi:hypothetical protein